MTPKEKQRRELLDSLELFGLVEEDAERLVRWIEKGSIPGITLTWE